MTDDILSLFHRSQPLLICLDHVRDHHNDPASLLAIVQAFIQTPTSIHEEAAATALQHLWKLRSSLKGDPLALHQLQLRISGHIGSETENGKRLALDLIDRLNQTKPTSSSQNALAALHIRARLRAFTPDLSIDELNRLYEASISWIKILSKSDQATSQKLALSVHHSLWKIASSNEGIDPRWSSLSLQSLLYAGTESSLRFYCYAFRVQESKLLDVNIMVMNSLTATNSRTAAWNDVLLRWAYRLAHTAFVVSNRRLIETKLIPFISNLSVGCIERQLLHWWESFINGAAIPEPLSNVTVYPEVVQEVVKRCAGWCRTQIESNHGHTKCSSTLIPLPYHNYSKAVFLSAVFELAASVLNSLEFLIRAIQCRFSPSADHERVLSLLTKSRLLLDSDPNPASISVLCSSLFNACAILFNNADNDRICIKYLMMTSECLSKCCSDKKRTELWCKVLEMSAAVLLRQGDLDILHCFRFVFQQSKIEELSTVMKTFVNCKLRFAKSQEICSSGLYESHDQIRLLLLLKTEYDCYNELQCSSSVLKAKTRVLRLISDLKPSSDNEFLLASCLRKDKQYECALLHARKALQMVDDESINTAQIHVLIAALLHDSHNNETESTVEECYSHLDDAIRILVTSSQNQFNQDSSIALKSHCSQLLKLLFQQCSRFTESDSCKPDTSTNILLSVLDLESKLDRRGHIGLLQVCVLLLDHWTHSELQISTDSLAVLVDVLSNMRLEKDCPGSISSLPLVQHPLLRIIILQNAFNAIALRSMKSICDATNLPRLYFAISLVDYQIGNLLSSLTWAAQAIHYQLALKTSSISTCHRLKIFFYHMAKLSEMTGNHTQGVYYYNQCLNIAKSHKSLLYQAIALCGLAHIQCKRQNCQETERLLSEIQPLCSRPDFQFPSVWSLALLIEGDFKSDPELYHVALNKEPGVKTRARILRRIVLFDQKRRIKFLPLLNELLLQLGSIERARTYLVMASIAMKSFNTNKFWSRFGCSEPDDDQLVSVLEYLRQSWILSVNAPMPSFRRRLMMCISEVYGYRDPILVAWALNAGLGITSATEMVLESSLFNDSIDDLTHHLSSLSLGFDFETLTEQFNQKFLLRFPSEWNVVTLVTSSTYLYMCSLRRDNRPLIVRVPRGELDGIIQEFDAIMERNKVTTRTGANTAAQKRDWWSERHQLDRRLNQVLSNLEDGLLGFYKGLLCASSTKFVNAFCTSDNEYDRTNLEILAAGCPYLTENQLESSCSQLGISKSQIEDLRQNLIHDPSMQQPPLILILDEVIQRLPWESMTCLKHRPVYRLPSLDMLAMRLNMKPLDPGLSFYMLNPGNDLPETQARMENEFRKRSGWKGIIGSSPSKQVYQEALSAYDVFIYCGHSSGEQYFGQQDLRKMKIRSASLLLGCSSGMLRGAGQYEPRGTCLAYLQAGCPAVLGNLWDVTDFDIDRFSQALLNNWIDCDLYPDLCLAVARSRTACKLNLLNGAAPVCYGVPVYSRHLGTRETTADATNSKCFDAKGCERYLDLKSDLTGIAGSHHLTDLIELTLQDSNSLSSKQPVESTSLATIEPTVPTQHTNAFDMFKTPKPLTRSRRMCPPTLEKVEPRTQPRKAKPTENISTPKTRTPRISRNQATPLAIDPTLILNTPGRVTRSMTSKPPQTPASKMR